LKEKWTQDVEFTLYAEAAGGVERRRSKDELSIDKISRSDGKPVL